MKKAIAAVLSSALIIAICVMMSACSTSIVGTWKFSKMSMSYGAIDINIEAGKEYEGKTITADDLVLEVKADNTYTITGTLTDMMGDSASGTWEEVDGKYYIVEGTEKIEVVVQGSTLIIDQSASGATVRIEFKR